MKCSPIKLTLVAGAALLLSNLFTLSPAFGAREAGQDLETTKGRAEAAQRNARQAGRGLSEKALDRLAEKVADKLATKAQTGAETKSGQNAAKRAEKRKKRAEAALARRSKSSEGELDEMEGEEAEAPEGPGAQVAFESHVLYLKDGSKLPCSVLMKGGRSVVVLTADGELEFHPDDIEMIQDSEEQPSPAYAAAEVFEGHKYLAAPEIEDEGEMEEEVEEEYDDEAGEEAGAADEEATGSEEGTESIEVPEVSPLLNVPLLGKPDDDEEAEAPSEIPTAEVPTLKGAPAVSPAPGAAKETLNLLRIRPAVEAADPAPRVPAVTTTQPRRTTQPPRTAKPRTQPATVAVKAPQPAQKPKAEPPAEAKDGKKQGFSDLLKSLESKDGLDSVLDQLRNNPDFYKSIDINK